MSNQALESAKRAFEKAQKLGFGNSTTLDHLENAEQALEIAMGNDPGNVDIFITWGDVCMYVVSRFRFAFEFRRGASVVSDIDPFPLSP